MGNRAKHLDRGTPITVCDGVTTLPFIPVESGDATVWAGDTSVMPVFDLEIHANGTVALTDIELFGLVTVDAVAKWMSYGFLGIASDGAIALTVNKGYSTRINHRPRTEAYAIAGTHPGTIEVTCTLHAVQDIS